MKNRAYYENLRDQMINQKVAYLLEAKDTKVDNYYPFNIDNFAEFLQNIPAVDFAKVLLMAEMTFQGSNNSATLGGVDISKGALRYWKRQAEEKAEKETPSIEELEFNERRN